MCRQACENEDSRPCQNCRGYYINDYSFDSDGFTEVENLVAFFKRAPTRINFLSLNGDAQAQVICEMAKQGVHGLVFVNLAWSIPSAYLMRQVVEKGGGCDYAVLESQATRPRRPAKGRAMGKKYRRSLVRSALAWRVGRCSA